MKTFEPRMNWPADSLAAAVIISGPPYFDFGSYVDKVLWKDSLYSQILVVLT